MRIGKEIFFLIYKLYDCPPGLLNALLEITRNKQDYCIENIKINYNHIH